MVVSHLRGVEDALGLLQRFATDGLDQFRIGSHTTEFRLIQSVERLRTLGVDIVREVLRVHTGIGGEFFLIETLDQVQRHFCRVGELAVTVHLQRGEVVELGRLFLAFLLLHLRYGEGLALDGGKGLFALLLRSELSLRGCKGGIAIHRCQHPIGLRLEVLNLLLTVYDECEGRGLHTAYGEHLTVLPVFQCIETRGIHA